MKNSKRIFAVLLTVIMALCAVTPTFFASAATKSLSAGTLVKVASDGYYKISVPGEGVLTVTAKWDATKDRASAYGYFYILNSKKKEFDSYGSYVGYSAYNEAKTKTVKTAVSKGTYLIQAKGISVSNGGNVQLKYTFKSIKQPTNYCIGKAISLEAGKKVTMYQTQQQSFNRWFKIKLTKAKKVTLSKTGSGSISMIDAEGTDVSTRYNSDKSTAETSVYNSELKLAAGTYYICVTTYKPIAKTAIVTLKWS